MQKRFVHDLLRARDYQERSEADALSNWWRGGHGENEGSAGVCALWGIGGAGKTAIVDRFLRRIPGALPEHPDLPKDLSLTPPERLFVFSFYNAPNPDSFFGQLAAWLQNHVYDDSVRPPSYEQTLQLIEQAKVCLLVLDGLEKAQEDGLRGTAFGRINDGRLRDFILRIAEGYLSNVRVIITTRFRLFDTRKRNSPYFREIRIEKLEPLAAVSLLRVRGVKQGTYLELEAIARDQGFHALSVDLMGGYISRFCNGDPARLPPLVRSPEWDQQHSERNFHEELDPEVAAVREQERRFARLAARYRDALAANEPAALAVLQRVCLFRLGVDTPTLASIFLGSGKETISGSHLAALSPGTLQKTLDLLSAMRLLEAGETAHSSTNHPLYTVHPAVRDGFLQSLDPDTARKGNEAAREGLIALLNQRPGAQQPSDPATLDLMEEIIYHTLQSGHVREAWEVYSTRMGGYGNLGFRLSAHERGDRICRAFVGVQSPEVATTPRNLSSVDQVTFNREWAQYLIALGRLSSAAYRYNANVAIGATTRKDTSIDKQILAEIHLLSGRLREALSASHDAIASAKMVREWEQHRLSIALMIHAQTLRGRISAVVDAVHGQQSYLPKTLEPLYRLRGIYTALYLVRYGQYQKAIQLLNESKKILQANWGTDGMGVHFCNLLLAEVSCKLGDHSIAHVLLEQAQNWAIAQDSKELLCRAALVRVRLWLSDFEKVESVNGSPINVEKLRELLHVLERGLRIARECGYGIYHIDLVLLSSRLHLMGGNAAACIFNANIALRSGYHPSPDLGHSELLPSLSPECRYAWGTAEALYLLSQGLLLEVAQAIGCAHVDASQLSALPPPLQERIREAQILLQDCISRRKQLKDPLLRQARQAHAQLELGNLTSYSLHNQLATLSFSLMNIQASSLVRDQIFISYSHKDKRWLDEIQKTLKPLVRQDKLQVWADTRIRAGQQWRNEIKNALAKAKVAVLLVSRNFLESDFIYKEELPPLLSAAKAGGLTIIWVAIEACLFDATELADYQAVNDPSIPLSSFDGNQAQLSSELVRICRELVRAMNQGMPPSP